MKATILTSALLGTFALAAPAFSQAPTQPAQPQAQQSAPPQTQGGGMCDCCRQMVTRMQQPGAGGMPMMPMSPAPPPRG